MKKMIFLLIMFSSFSFVALADEPIADEDPELQQMMDSLKEEPRKPAPHRAASQAPTSPDKLVDMDQSRILVRLNDLEQQVRNLTRENRELTEQVRVVERSVDNIKRRV